MKTLFTLLLTVVAFFSTTTMLKAQCLTPVVNAPTSTAYTMTETWAPAANVSYYDVRFRAVGSPTWINGTSSAATVSRTYSNLNASTSYEFQIRTNCIGGTNSGFSASIIGSTTAATGCQLPTVLTTSVTTPTSATFTFPNIPTAGWYEFRYKEASSGIWITVSSTSAPATSKIISGLVPNTLYDIQTRTFCSPGIGSLWSNTLQFTTTVAAPTLTASIINANNATVTYPAVSGALWYEFRYKEASSGTWLSGGTANSAATSKLFTGLTPSTAYNVQARTFGPTPTSVPSTWSTTLNFSTIAEFDCQAPPAIGVSILNATNATVTWTAVNLAAWYEFEYQVVGSGVWNYGGTAISSATSKLITGLTQNTSYIVRARTYCANQIPSSWYSIPLTTIEAQGCELAPTPYQSAMTPTSVTFSWDAVIGAAWLEYSYSIAGSGVWSSGSLPANATTKAFNNLMQGDGIVYQMRSYCSNGQPSEWSSLAWGYTEGGGAINKPAEQAQKNLVSESNEAMIVFPNPTNDIVKVQATFNQANTTVVVKITDMSGRIVSEIETLSIEGLNTIEIDLTSVNSGIYSVELFNNNAIVDRTRVRKN